MWKISRNICGILSEIRLTPHAVNTVRAESARTTCTSLDVICQIAEAIFFQMERTQKTG